MAAYGIRKSAAELLQRAAPKKKYSANLINWWRAQERERTDFVFCSRDKFSGRESA